MTDNNFDFGSQALEQSPEGVTALNKLAQGTMVASQLVNNDAGQIMQGRIDRLEQERLEIKARVSVFAELQISCNSKGPKQTSSNYVALLRNHPEFSNKPIRKDLFSSRIYIGEKPFTDEDLAIINAKFSDITDCQMENRQKIYDAIIRFASENTFNQLTEYLDSLRWDGINRIPTLFVDFLGAENKELYKTMAKLWMIGAVKRAYEPGCKFDNIVILSGPQGIGKSNFCERMAVRQEWYCENVQIGAKDGYIQLLESWIVNMDEIASLSKKDSATAKNFLTSRQDKFRSPYGRFSESYDRHCVFIGTTNDERFLKDSTAVTERRYWVVPCSGTRSDAINRYKKLTPEYVDQLWAEAVSYYKESKKNGNEIPLYIPENLWEEFVSEQLKHKQEDDSELFIFLDDALNREYMDFLDDSSLSKQYASSDCPGVKRLQDKFSINAINQLLRDQHIVTWKGCLKQYAEMRPNIWTYQNIRNGSSVKKGLKRVKESTIGKPELLII